MKESAAPRRPGRPGEGRAAHGRVRAQILPELKETAEKIAEKDLRIRSFSRLIESAVKLFIREYEASGGVLDTEGIPVMAVPPPAKSPPSPSVGVESPHERIKKSNPHQRD